MTSPVPTTSALRATAHPLRLQILSLLTSAELCAAEVARELGTTQANASYHVRVLANAGLLVRVGEVRIRGGVAKRYRHQWQVADTPGRQKGTEREPQDRHVLVAAIAQELVRRSAQWTGGPGIVTDAELWVSPDSWTECVDLVAQASRLLHGAARPPRTDGTLRVNMSTALFAMAEAGDPDGTA